MYLKLAWRNIWRNKRRSLITIGSMTFAVFLACVMRSMQLGSYERMIENSARFYTGYIQIHANGYWDEKIIDNVFDSNPDIFATVSEIEGVEVAVPRVESFAMAAYRYKTKGALVLGMDPTKEDELTNVKSKLVEGRYLEPDDSGILIASGLADYLRVGLGDSLILISQGYHGSNAAGIFPIRGIMEFPVPEQNDQTLYLTLSMAQWYYDVEDKLTSIALVVDEAKNVDRIVTELSANLDLETLEVMGWQEMMPDLVQGIEIDSISGRIMLWILYAVIGFGIFGTFLMLTAERMYEFGVMMSIGMKRLKMQLTVFLEMAIMTSLGVISGVGLCLPLLVYFHYNPIRFGGKAAEAIEKFGVEAAYFFSLEPSLFYNQAWVVFFMSILLGFYPLLVINNLQPVKAMREG